MSSSATLDEIEAYLDAFEQGLQAADPAALELDVPVLRGELQPADAPRANALFGRLRALHERAEGQRVRVAGELADLRRRNANAGHRRAPSTFDRRM
jgi:hypothetical protein